jgi:hypothetical protein
MDENRVHLICHSHGAVYRTADGYCLSGPCDGQSLIHFNVSESRREHDPDSDPGAMNDADQGSELGISPPDDPADDLEDEELPAGDEDPEVG